MWRRRSSGSRAAARGIVAAAAACAAIVSAEPPQPPAFRAGGQGVPVFATVTDDYGQIVKDLTRDDFDVFDNGKRQDITLFSSGLHPITAVVLLDTSNSMTLNIEAMKQAAEQF